MYSVQFIMYSVQYIVYSLLCTVYCVQSRDKTMDDICLSYMLIAKIKANLISIMIYYENTMYASSFHSVQRALFVVQLTVYIAQCTIQHLTDILRIYAHISSHTLHRLPYPTHSHTRSRLRCKLFTDHSYPHIDCCFFYLQHITPNRTHFSLPLLSSPLLSSPNISSPTSPIGHSTLPKSPRPSPP